MMHSSCFMFLIDYIVKQKMNYPPYNPSYYRSHLYAHQNNLPDSAFNNRRLPLYSSEMPQGNDPFLPSHKKHFQRVGYRSVITQEQIINHQSPEEADSPAKNKEYYRNLSIEDIEGASTNTLISQAIKNRIKAKEHFLRKQKNQYSEAMIPKEDFYQPAVERQEEAVKLIQRYKKEENYHQRNRAVKTQASAETSYFKAQPNQEKISEYKTQIEQTEKEIHDLEKRLDFAKQKAERQRIQSKFQLKIQEDSTRQKTVPIEQSGKSDVKLPKITHPQELDLMVRPGQSRKGKNQQLYDTRKRSYTQPQQPEPFSYPMKDAIIEDRKEERLSRMEQSRIRRQQIRKMNPTYLSYGSSSINQRRVFL